MSLNIYDVPSKCRFDLLQLTLEWIRDRKGISDLVKVTDQHPRHAHFLIQNAIILGFARKGTSSWELTDSGNLYLENKSDQKESILTKAMLDTRVISFIIEQAGTLASASRLSIKQISQLLLNNTILSRGSIEGISKTTSDRRAASVKGWLKWLELSLRKFSNDPKDELLLAEQETLDHYDE